MLRPLAERSADLEVGEHEVLRGLQVKTAGEHGGLFWVGGAQFDRLVSAAADVLGAETVVVAR
jgi:hypothetical protein